MKTLEEQIDGVRSIDARPWTHVYEKINSAPPIAERPKCPACGTPLRPWWDTHSEEKSADGPGRVTWQVWKGDYHGYGAFCTLRCCERFANAAHKAGYRLTHKGSKP